MKTFKYFSYILLLCMAQSIFCALSFTHSSVWMAAVVLTWSLLVQAVFLPIVPMMWVASGVFAIAEVLREKL